MRVLVAGLALVIAACGTTVVSGGPHVLTVPGMVGTDSQMVIVDETGELVNARALSGDAIVIAAKRLEGPISALAGDATNEARIVWISSSCETSSRLTITNPNKVTITPGPLVDCDAVGNFRAVDLVFRVPVNPAALYVELIGMEKG
jgi:hypothetical protein